MKHGLITFLGDLIKGAATINEFSTDGTMAGNSDSTISTQKAVKTYADTKGDVKYSDDRYKVVSFTRDLTTATGSQAITGVGFQPTALIAFAGVELSTLNFVNNSFTDGTTNGGRSNYTTSGAYTVHDRAFFIMQSGSVHQSGSISSFDSDGFTISWSKTGSPTGTATIKCLALR